MVAFDKAIANCQKKAKDLARDLSINLIISDSEENNNRDNKGKKSKKYTYSYIKESDAKYIKLRVRDKLTRIKDFLASGLSLTNFYNLLTRPLKSLPLINAKDFYKRYGNLADKAQKRAL